MDVRPTVKSAKIFSHKNSLLYGTFPDTYIYYVHTYIEGEAM